MNKAIDDILKRYPHIWDDIQKLQSQLNISLKLQQEARNPLKAQELKDKVSMGEISDQTFNAVERIIDRYQAEIDSYIEQINELLTQKKWLDKAFAELIEDERRIVYQYYDRRVTVNKLAYILKCDRRKIYRMLDSAKEKISRIMFT